MILGALVLALTTACGSASTNTGGKTGLAYFNGKTITYIVPDTPGSSDGLQIIAMQPALEQYLHAKINVQYVQGARTIGQNRVANSTPDGLTIGVMPIKTDLTDIYADRQPLSFDLQKISIVGATNTGPTLVVACKDSPYKTFDDVIAGTTQARVVNVTNGADNEKAHLLMNAFNIPHTYLEGYNGATSSVGCQRGDGNIAMQSVPGFSNSAGTALDPGLTPLLLIGSIPKGSTYNFLGNVPDLTSFAKTHQPATPEASDALNTLTAFADSASPQFVTFGPPGIPADTLAALTDAMRTATNDAAVQKSFLGAGIPPGILPAEPVAAYIKSQINEKAIVEKFLKD